MEEKNNRDPKFKKVKEILEIRNEVIENYKMYYRDFISLLNSFPLGDTKLSNTEIIKIAKKYNLKTLDVLDYEENVGGGSPNVVFIVRFEPDAEYEHINSLFEDGFMDRFPSEFLKLSDIGNTNVFAHVVRQHYSDQIYEIISNSISNMNDMIKSKANLFKCIHNGMERMIFYDDISIDRINHIIALRNNAICSKHEYYNLALHIYSKYLASSNELEKHLASLQEICNLEGRMHVHNNGLSLIIPVADEFLIESTSKAQYGSRLHNLHRDLTRNAASTTLEIPAYIYFEEDNEKVKAYFNNKLMHYLQEILKDTEAKMSASLSEVNELQAIVYKNIK